MVMSNIRELILSGHTQLALGPTSVNCVNAAIQTAGSLQQPLMLIASRNQIECSDLGGGYVNRWTTQSFARYVRMRDLHGLIALCRDHGGPRQHPTEDQLSDIAALESAKCSLKNDVLSGFDMLHLDLSQVAVANAVDYLADIYEYVCDLAVTLKRSIELEVGMEVQSDAFGNIDEFRLLLNRIRDLCDKKGLKFPFFIVAQTGTLVDGLANSGGWNLAIDSSRASDLIRKTKALTNIASEFGSFVKEHNGDYLSEEALRLRPVAKIGGINIAPELGVFETKCLLDTFRSVGCFAEAEAFLTLAYESRKWTKWFQRVPSASDLDKAIAAGHYVFATDKFHDISSRVMSSAKRKGIDLDDIVVRKLARYIEHLMTCLRSL